MAKKRNGRSGRSGGTVGSASFKPVKDRVLGLQKPDVNQSARAGSSVTDGSFERSKIVATRKSKVGVAYVLNETIDDALKRDERHTWSRNGLVPRSKLKLQLTKKQHKAVQTPSYLR